MYIPYTGQNNYDLKELADERAKNKRLKEELELARLRKENAEMEKEINRLNSSWPIVDLCPYPYPNIIYCDNTL